MKTIVHHKITIIISAVALGLLLTGAAFFSTLQWINSDRIVPGLTVAGLEIGGLKLAEAKNILANQLDEFGQQKVTFVFAERRWLFSLSELGFNLDLEKTFGQASLWGRHSNIFLGAKEQIESLLRGKNLSVILDFDSAQFNQTLSKFAPIIEEPARNAKLTYDQKKDDFYIAPETPGQIIDRDQLKENLTANFRQLSNEPIKLTLVIASPQVSAKNLEAVKAQAQKLINQAPYFVKTEGLSWPIDKQELAKWISVLPSSGALTLDQNEIEDFLSPIASNINQEPVNAKLTLENNKIEVFALSQNGKKLNIEASGQKIVNEILAGQITIELLVESIEPEITTENIDSLGLTSLLGRGESNFIGSPANRKFNIALAASKLNGWLIKPEEEFSFSQSLGEIDEKNGYLPELVIKNKQTIPEAGGGVCHVSTTLFRAAINSGLKIIERYPHAYPVRYYNPPGFDATVYPPKPDLKFLNDTPAYILLQSKIQDTKLFFEIYGTADGREIKIIGPTITQSNPDGSLKTILTQEIWRAGELERQDVFRSSYNSPNLYPNPNAKPSPTPSPTPIATPTPTAAPQP